jgi:hypothetical protein
VGIDRRGTSVQGLELALDLFNRVEIVHDITGRTFHPKIYMAGTRQAWHHLIIGSSNLTAGGVFFNYEASCYFELGSAAADKNLATAVDDYFRTLRGDPAICVTLTKATLAKLKSANRLADENARSGDNRDEDSLRRGRPDALFSRSSIEKRQLHRAPRRGRGATPSGVPKRRVGTTPRVAATTPSGWWKKMNKTDAQRPPAGNPTGSVRLIKGQTKIDPSTYFRNSLFASANWQSGVDGEGNSIEVASVVFDVVINGRSRGKKTLRVDYGSHRQERGRATTVLHWDDLRDAVERTNFEGRYLVLERLPTGVYRLEITTKQPA